MNQRLNCLLFVFALLSCLSFARSIHKEKANRKLQNNESIRFSEIKNQGFKDSLKKLIMGTTVEGQWVENFPVAPHSMLCLSPGRTCCRPPK